MSESTDLYRVYSASGALLYVGISYAALMRLAQHKEHATWFRDMHKLEVAKYPSREAALNAEREAIISEQPKFNVMHNRKRHERKKPVDVVEPDTMPGRIRWMAIRAEEIRREERRRAEALRRARVDTSLFTKEEIDSFFKPIAKAEGRS